MRGALQRWGGVFIAPRRHVASLALDEGQRDGLVLGLLYVIATGSLPIAASVATALASTVIHRREV